MNHAQQLDMDLRKLLSNPMGRDVQDIYPIPEIGQKFTIINFDGFTASTVGLVYREYNNKLTIADVIPIIIGNGESDPYHWEYEIEIKERYLELETVLQGAYKLL
jgi:hypothetical protein